MAIVLKRDTTLNQIKKNINNKREDVKEEESEIREKIEEYREINEVKIAEAKRAADKDFFFSGLIRFVCLSIVSILSAYVCENHFLLLIPLGLVVWVICYWSRIRNKRISEAIGEKYRRYKRKIKKEERNIALNEKKINEIRAIEKERQAQLKGNAGEQAVIGYIENHFDDKNYLINDIYVCDGYRKTQIDHILVTPKGIFCIETKNYSGLYLYAGPKMWVYYKNSQPHYIPSPQEQSQYHVEVLNAALEIRGLRNIPLVIIANPYGRYEGDTVFCRVIKLEQLKDLVDSYEEIYSEKEVKNIADAILKTKYKKINKKLPSMNVLIR